MHRNAIWVLLALVLTLGALAWRERAKDERAPPAGLTALLPGLDAGRIQALRIDNLERGLQMRVARSTSGDWGLTDPLEFPADPAVLQLLLDALTLNQVEPFEGEPAALSLAPPRAVVEVEAEGAQGPRRVELGAVDVDQQHVIVRVDGKIGRTLRNLDNALERDLAEWRDHSIVRVAPTSIAELSRTGKTRPRVGSAPQDLSLTFAADGGFRASAPFEAQLAPERVGLLLTSVATLRASGFEDDAPGDLALYGLDPPDVRVQFTTVAGDSTVLRIAYVPNSERLRVAREDRPYVYSIAPENAAGLFLDGADLVDREIVRAQRQQIVRVRLAGERCATTLERTQAGWNVRGHGADGAEVERNKADAARVSDLLAAIERARVLELLPDVAWPADWDERGIFVDVEGATLGGAIGPTFDSPRGTRGRLFRRAGDRLVGLVDEELARVAGTDPSALRSEELHRVSEIDVAQVDVRAAWANVQRTWQRSTLGKWTPQGSEAEARDFAPLVDALLAQRARRFLPARGDLALERPIDVLVRGRDGQPLVVFTLAQGPAQGSAQASDAAAVAALYLASGTRAEVDGALYAALSALLAP